MMEYNTTRSNLILREYGRNFHKLVDYVGNVKSKEKRNNMSKSECGDNSPLPYPPTAIKVSW